MNSKKRKILKRVGAALMLGLSLFGLGTRTSRGQDRLMPKKVRNIRKEEKENLSAEQQEMLSSVEEEAKKSIQEEETQQQKEEQDSYSVLTRQQAVLRYAALSVWVIGFGFFFSSLVFNTPFALGKKFMSVLPGNPHLAKMSLAAERRDEGSQLVVFLRADSSGDSVHFLKANLNFDRETMYLDKYEINQDKISKVGMEEKISNNSSQTKLNFNFESSGKNFKNDEVAKLYFTLRKNEGSVKVGINQEESLMLSKKEDKTENILGEVENLYFNLD